MTLHGWRRLPNFTGVHTAWGALAIRISRDQGKTRKCVPKDLNPEAVAAMRVQGSYVQGSSSKALVAKDRGANALVSLHGLPHPRRKGSHAQELVPLEYRGEILRTIDRNDITRDFVFKSELAALLECDFRTIDARILAGTIPPPHAKLGKRQQVWLRRHYNVYVKTGQWPKEAFK